MAIFADEFADLMSSTVTVQSFAGRMDDGTPIYATPVSYIALVENNVRNTIGANGQLVAARGAIYMDTVDLITANDLVTIPGSQVAVVILSVNVYNDENGQAATVLYFQ